MINHFGLDRQYQNLKHELLDATDLVLKSGRLVDGAYTVHLENWLALRTSTEYAIVVHSGTQALEIIAHYLETYGPAHIRIPNLTYVATLNAFMNKQSNRCNDYPYKIELIDTDSYGIMNYYDDDFMGSFNCYVGLYGAPTPEKLHTGCVVDGAQHWLIANGNIGLAMAISFDPTKNLPASGNGGAIVTNDKQLYEFANIYRNNGKDTRVAVTDRNMLIYGGTNSKMSELDCAHVLVRANYIDQWQNRRKQIRYYYIDRFKNLPVRCLSENFDTHSDQKFVIDVADQRNALQEFLTNKGIITKIHYDKPLSELVTAKNTCTTVDFMSVSAMLSRSVLSLPIYPELSDYEIEYITDMVVAFYDK